MFIESRIGYWKGYVGGAPWVRLRGVRALRCWVTWVRPWFWWVVGDRVPCDDADLGCFWLLLYVFFFMRKTVGFEWPFRAPLCIGMVG